MSGRGSFVNVNSGNFAFRDDGQTYFSIGMIDDNIKVLERPNNSVKAPEMSHTENRIYAVLQKGELKHIAFYDEKHQLVKSIDFLHSHDGNNPMFIMTFIIKELLHHQLVVTKLSSMKSIIG